MKKSLFAIFMVAVLSVAMILPAMAAEVSADEQGLLDKFNAEVDAYSSILGADIASQYKTEAETALTKVELDAAACADLSAAIDTVDGILKSNNVSTKAEGKAVLPEVLKAVNAVANKYNMNVTVDDAKTGYATVTINGNVVADTSTNVNQTGFGLAQTVAVVAAVVLVLGGAFVVARKNRLFA